MTQVSSLIWINKNDDPVIFMPARLLARPQKAKRPGIAPGPLVTHTD